MTKLREYLISLVLALVSQLEVHCTTTVYKEPLDGRIPGGRSLDQFNTDLAISVFETNEKDVDPSIQRHFPGV